MDTPRHRQPVAVRMWVKVDLDLFTKGVVKLHDSAGARVDKEAPLLALDHAAHLPLQARPVAAVERLPLRGHVDEVEGGVLEGVVDEVGVGRQVPPGQEDVSGVRDVLGRGQVEGAHLLPDGDLLPRARVAPVDVQAVGEVIRGVEARTVVPGVSAHDLPRQDVAGVQGPGRSCQMVGRNFSPKKNI